LNDNKKFALIVWPLSLLGNMLKIFNIKHLKV